MLPIVIQNIIKYMPIMAFQGLQAGRDQARRSSTPPGPVKRSAHASPRQNTAIQAKNATSANKGGAA
uniref:Phospholipid-transporting ATPase (EC) n=1 Tax=Ganoderma boninense TaxID=34458 RepID=A0A5K1K3C5_9APHY|nr:Phospholipid-transporting ATPase (EC [Ganoderma boninense]